MFPSSGFFKGIVCPYLASGLCERPYCHYRHTGLKPADKRPAELVAGPVGTTSNASDRLPSYKSTTPIEAIDVSAADVGQAQSHHMPSMLNMVGRAAVLYRPTPKATPKSVVAAKPASRSKDGVPEYTPTPIHLLNQTRSKVDDLEYDPISNYSTKMRPLGSVRVTLADAERDTSLKRPLPKADAEASLLAKRPKLGDVSAEVEARFSEDEDVVMVETKIELGDANAPLSASLESSSAVKTHNAVEISSDMTPTSDILKDLDFAVSSKSKTDVLGEERNEPKVTEETSPKCGRSVSKNGDLDHREVSDSSAKNRDTSNKDGLKKDQTGESDVRESEPQKGENGGNVGTHVIGKSAEKSEAVNKENKRQSASKDDVEGSSANHRNHRSNHHHRSSNHKSVSKEHKVHLKEPLQRVSEHVKHSTEHRKPSNKEHEHSKKHKEQSKPSVKHSEGSDLTNDRRQEKSSNEKRQNDSRSSSTHEKSNTDGAHKEKDIKSDSKCPEKHVKSDSKYPEKDIKSDSKNPEKDAKSDSKCPSAAREYTQNPVKDSSVKSSSAKDPDCKALSRSVSEHAKSGETRVEKSARRGSVDVNEKKHRIEPAIEVRPSSLHDAAEGTRPQTDARPDSSKSNACSSRGKHRTLSNSSSSSNKTKSTIISKAIKRTISQVDLFGEDSDTERDMKEKRPVTKLVSGDGRRRPAKRSRTSRDTDDSDVSSFDVISDSLDESDNPSCSRFEECHRLFLEAERHEGSRAATKPTGAKDVKVAPSIEDLPPPPSGKKRLAHTPLDDMEVRRIVPEPKRVQPSAGKVMLNRYLDLQKSAASNKLPLSPDEAIPNSVAPALASGCAGTSSTASLKVKPRVAHVPKSGDFLKKPILTVVGSSKLPVNVRQSCLEKIFTECCNLYDEAQDAKDRAAAEEKAIYEKSATKSIYLNLISNAVRRLRDESPFSKTLSPKNPNACSHEAILGGSKAASTSFTVNRWGKLPAVPNTFSGAELYKRLSVYLMSEAQLVENSFPQPNPNNADEVIIRKSERDLQKPQSSDPNQKFCCRCGKAFFILPDGSFVREEECIYHWGHAWKQRVGGTFDNIYNCCGGDLSSRGCQMSKCHVHDDNKHRCVTGYMSTMPSSPRNDGDFGVYAIDCEMVYTTFGFELARVTVIGPNLELVLDKIVKPDHKVIDYNTRFSGLTADDLKNVSTSIRDIQAIFLHMFNSKTILIGHSLESDLVALKLVHHTVVDTSIVFPHRRGLPFKRALQNVVKETLQKIIQNNISGHDSSEDARSCMELMLWKVKEDAKRSLRFA